MRLHFIYIIVLALSGIAACNHPDLALGRRPFLTRTAAAPLDEKEGRKVDAYTRACINGFSGPLETLRTHGGYGAPGFSGYAACRIMAETRRRLGPAMPEADDAAMRMGVAVETLDPLLRELEQYEGRGQSVLDGGARGAQLRAAIAPTLDRALRAERDLRAALGRIRPRVRAARIARLATTNRRLYLVERVAGQVALVMRIASTHGDEPPLPNEPTTLREAVPPLAQYIDELVGPTGRDFVYSGCLEELLRCALQLVRDEPKRTCSLDIRYACLVPEMNSDELDMWALPAMIHGESVHGDRSLAGGFCAMFELMFSTFHE